MFTPSTYPCVAWRINQHSHPTPVIVEEPYVGLYHTDTGMYLCEGGLLLHCSELYESIYQALTDCLAAGIEREDRRYKLVECNVPTGSALGGCSMSSINITPGRIKVLHAVQRIPGLYASGIADLFPRVTSYGTTIGWSAQGATRFGCGYAQPLVNAGLLRKDTDVRCGGARYFLTSAGEAVISNATGGAA